MTNASQRIRSSIDEYFADMDERYSLQFKVLEQTRGKLKVKRKLSVGLALTIVFMLLVAGAVAAVILSMQQIVEEQAIPMANEYEGEAYTTEDTNTLVVLAEENGIMLSTQTKAQIQQALYQGKGYFKEELLMALAKAEFGENPASWTLEQQKWFDDVCVAIGFIEEPEKAMPEGGEEAKDAIVRAAADYIHQTYDSAAQLDDASKYEIGVQYINGGEDDEYQGLYWSIDYSPLYLEGAKYWVYLRDDGTVLGDVMRSGLNMNSTVSDVYDSYWRVFGSDFTWGQGTLRSFQIDAMKATDTDSMAYLCFARTSYPDIPEAAISQEQAYSIAADYLGVDQNLGRSQLFLIGDDPNPVWKLYIAQDDNYWSVEVDCITGEIKTMRQLLDNTYRRWWMRLVLWETVNEVEEIWVDNSPPAVG